MSARLPAGTGTAVAGAVAGLVAFALAGVGLIETAVGGAGLLVLALGAVVAAPRLVSLGGAGLFVAVLVAGTAGDAPAAAVLAAGTATLLAWTWIHTAVGLRETLGAGRAGGIELAHVVGTTALAVGGAVVAFAAFDVGWVRLPPTALLALVVGGAALVAALRRELSATAR